MNTLYITDLDGTLLNTDGLISDYSAEVLNALIDKGMNISIATARTAATANGILSKVRFKQPAILMNGMVLYDLENKKYLSKHEFASEQRDQIYSILDRLDIPAFVYTIQHDELICYTYTDERITPEMRYFKKERVDDYNKRFDVFENYDQLKDKKVIYFTLLGQHDVLAKLDQALKVVPDIDTVLYLDVYTDDWILEIHVGGIDKGVTCKELLKLTGADNLVVFGDNTNDIPMVEEAKYSYAVSNAKQNLKELVDEIILSNDEDAVAKKLLEISQH